MPMNNFNIGRDVSINLTGQNGQVVSFNLVTGFDKKQITEKVTITGLDGVTRYLEIPEGWDGTIDVTRADRGLDDLIASLEDMYYAGKNVLGQSITETIQETDGSISQWRYDGVMFKLSDGGKFKGKGDVPMRLDWCASRRRKVV